MTPYAHYYLRVCLHNRITHVVLCLIIPLLLLSYNLLYFAIFILFHYIPLHKPSLLAKRNLILLLNLKHFRFYR
jgi:hypothetical protein